MAPVTTLSQVRRRLAWHNVTEAAWPDTRTFSAWPDGKWLPPVELVFDPAGTELYQLNFGPWHMHFDESPDERVNVRRALATARAIVAGARRLLVVRGADGRYLGSTICRRDALPARAVRDDNRVEMIVFNEPPRDVSHGAADPTTSAGWQPLRLTGNGE